MSGLEKISHKCAEDDTTYSVMNVRRRKLHGLLLSAGLLISFITSIALLAWHAHGLFANDRPSFFPPNDVAEGGGGGGGAPPRSRGDHGGGWPPVLSAYAEPSHATDAWYDGGPAGGRPNAPLLPRRTSRRDLARVAFPRVNYTSALACCLLEGLVDQLTSVVGGRASPNTVASWA